MEMDEGKWNCIKKNDSSTRISFDVVLESEDIPEITYADNGQQNDTVVEAGKVVTLKFHYLHPLDSCVWNTPHGVIIPTYPFDLNPYPGRFNTSYDKVNHPTCALTITGTSDTDNGVWTCSATASIEDRNRVCEIGKVSITVAKAPENITFEPTNVFAVKEKEFLVSCIVRHSRPEPRGVKWYIENDSIKPTIVFQSIDTGTEGYVDFIETISLKEPPSVNGKTLRCIYDHIAHQDGKDNNETKLTITVNEMKKSDVLFAAVGGTACAGLLVGFILGIVGLILYQKKWRHSDEDRSNLVNEQRWDE